MSKKILKHIRFYLNNRFILFLAAFLVFVVSSYFFSGSWLPTTETKDLWFYSGIFMVLFSILFIEPYYTSPKNVITNLIPLLLVFLPIRTSFNNPTFWNAAVTAITGLLIVSVITMALEDKNKSPDHIQNIIAEWLKNAVVIIGNGKVLYSSVFIYFLLSYHSIQNFYVLTLFVFWFFIILIDSKKIHNNFVIKKKEKNGDQIGEIFGVQSKKIFLVKLFEDKKSIKKFDVVKFKYSMQDSNDRVIVGIVFDTYLLNQEKWAKVLQLKQSKVKAAKLEKNLVYKVTDTKESKLLSKEIKVDGFVGIVIDNSTIGKIRFEYSKKTDDLQEGDLLELSVSNRRLFYQVVSGTTEKERIEARNETGFINGEAVQLGEWSAEELSFQKFGWVPTINTPIFKADTSDISVDNFKYPKYKLGQIPGTTLPSVIDLDESVRTHTALLGVTGAGKSFLAREIIKEITKDTKVICIDLTGEWENEISELKPEKLIDAEGLATVEATIAKKETATRSKNSSDVLKYKQQIQKKLDEYVEKFVKSENNLTIFELPDLSNTSFILEFTQMFMESIFLYAKKGKDNKFCIVLEEAHTVIPETTFLGDLGDYSSNKGLVSKMGQIALQGRKYGVGFLVIAQRTANVSKTVLTQCNTVICFQAFDETSFSFLGNYVGKDMVQALPNLKQYHAIVSGKAIKSNMPMIVDLTREVKAKKK